METDPVSEMLRASKKTIRSTKSKNPVIVILKHYHQNPLEYFDLLVFYKYLKPDSSSKYLFVSSYDLVCILITIFCCTVALGSRGSSVNIAPDYELEDLGSISDKGRGFFF
jgi:hypothetical protein